MTDNQVNISTGVVNATVDNTIYSDGQLAVYQVNQVLLPLSIFGTHPPAAAPAPIEAKKEKSKPTSEAPAASDDANTDTTSNSATRSGIDRSAVRVAFIGSLYLVAWWALC
jgi:hypothetical protein